MEPPRLDLSKAQKLKDVEFLLAGLDVGRTIDMPRTTRLESPRQIVIFLYPLPMTIKDTGVQEWQGLDHLLVRLWTSHSITPKIKYREGFGTDFGGLGPRLSPNLTGGGVVYEVWNGRG